MRQYDDPVEVRRGTDEGPEQFLWRGRLWKVRSVTAHWVETSPWWQAAGAVAQATRPDWSDPALHLMVALIDFAAAGKTRREVVEALKARGVGTQVHYIPVHTQPYYRQRYGELELPGANAWYERCLSLPLYPGMADEDVDHVVAALAEVLGL